MNDYIINKNKTFQTFLRTEGVIEKGKFPVVNQFIEDERNFFIEKIRKSVNLGGRIIEIGCGGGRLLRTLKSAGIHLTGFDNDKLLVDYCVKQGLDVFYGDATKKLPQKLKNTFKIVIIDFNTLFNFPKEVRKKWIKNAAFLLARGGLLLFTVYAKNKYADKTISERLKFYNYVIRPANGIKIKFSRKPKTCIKMVSERKILWFSEWQSKKELISEIRSWKNFALGSVTLMNSKTAFAVVLKRFNLS